MLYSYIRIPGIVWRYHNRTPFLDIDASLNSVDSFWYGFHYPEIDECSARAYVGAILKKIGENPAEIQQRIQEARTLEYRMNEAVSKRDPKERKKALRIAKVIRAHPKQSPFSVLPNRKKAVSTDSYTGADGSEFTDYELPGHDNLIPLEKAVLLK